MKKLEMLYSIELTLTALQKNVPFGLRKPYGVTRALWCVAELIEDEIKQQHLKGNTNVPPSYADSNWEELEEEYVKMQSDIKEGGDRADKIKTQ